MMGQDDSQRELSREVVTSTLDELTKLPEALMIERAYLEHQPAESPVVVSASRRRSPSESNPTQAQALMELARRKRSEALIESYDRRLDAAFESGSSWTAYPALLFYDYYSGVLIPGNDSFIIGDRSWSYEFEPNGETIDIGITHSSTSEQNVGDCRIMKTSSVIVSMPEDYDGLVFSVVPESASYSENVATGETLGVLDSYVVALELPFDVQDALNFRVCAY